MTGATKPMAPSQARASRRILLLLNEARQWFHDLRATRPFWGGLWTMAAGLWIISAMNVSIDLALTSNWPYLAGILIGVALVLFGLVAWFAPIYHTLLGIMCLFLALMAFPAANLGGYLVGSVVGILGASMMWSWGEKRPRGEARAAADEEVNNDA